MKECYFHPRELVIGVCALCLKERLLLVLASKQAHIHQTNTPLIRKVLPKIFSLTSLINPLYIIHHKSDEVHGDRHSSTSQEDSFISIKFEDNGVASWDKGKISKISNDHRHHQISHEMTWNDNNSLDKANNIKNVVEHAKPRTSLRWQKRIGQILQLIRWKRSASKGNMCHVGTKLESSRVKHGWIRILTKRRTKE